jgi:hypothetical protein
MKKRTMLLAAAITICLSACKKPNEYKGLDCSTINSSYSASIRPLVDRSCALSGCHDAHSSNGNFTTYEGLLTRVKNGTMANRVLYNKDMPPGNPLSIDDRRKIKCWIDAGAPQN